MIFADKLMYTGFAMATRAGISIAVDDMLVPTQKGEIIDEAEKEVQEIESAVHLGPGDRRASATTRWSTSGAAPATMVAKAMMEQLVEPAMDESSRPRKDKKGT